MADYQRQASDRMGKTIDSFKEELNKVRSGRASIGLIEPLKVECYQGDMTLNQIANVVAENATTISIQPWDKALIPAIEKAIMKSELGLMPQTSGTMIRLNFPALTQERRKEIVKLVKQSVESAKVAVRNIRRDVLQDIKEAVKSKEMSEDDERREQERLQKTTDLTIKKIEQIFQQKEQELLSL